ncbi:LysR substrate-binding domain-containing protein [Inquilinus sp.]|jgi:DNA-binding transcriptional LysR family regulator|uniref:LysR family transcriptional regulator n=1 Tax=Inquilinus sp. TaxID=1932117 RepID=UPI0037840020
MSDQLAALRLFVRIAATGSFSQAAREHSLTQPTVSRIIASLEATLGATLFLRTTRAVTLTETGADYLARVRPVLEALDEADHAARGDGELRGTLRIGVSSIMASRILVPMLSDFSNPHPMLRMELVIDDRRQDLISEHVDVALRFGGLPDSSAIARYIGRWPLIIAAAPSYLERCGQPTTPELLADHAFVVAGPVAKRGLTLRQGNRDVTVPVSGPIAITGAEVAINAGVAGLGIIAASSPSIAREIERGDLVRLLPDWEVGDLEAHALFPSGQSPKPSARAFVDFLIERIGTR